MDFKTQLGLSPETGRPTDETDSLADYVNLAPPGMEPDPAVLEGMEKAAVYLDVNLTTLPGPEVWNDPYSLSIAAVALGKVSVPCALVPPAARHPFSRRFLASSSCPPIWTEQVRLSYLFQLR